MLDVKNVTNVTDAMYQMTIHLLQVIFEYRKSFEELRDIFKRLHGKNCCGYYNIIYDCKRNIRKIFIKILYYNYYNCWDMSDIHTVLTTSSYDK